jgi:molybdopterin molybdotransferase
MITPDQALKLILGRAKVLPAETVDLREAHGRVVAGSVRAADSLPRFDNSAMDGFAVQAADLRRLPALLKLIGESRAGSPRLPRLQPGCAVKISTGAPIPPGADTVVMKEDCELRGASVLVKDAEPRGGNIRRRGEEIRKGAIAIKSGTVLNPGSIAWLASMGIQRVQVFCKPRVGLLRSGDEVVEWDRRPKRHQIRDTHAMALGLALKELGFELELPPPVQDRLNTVTRAFSKLLARCDVVLTTGGVSVGEHDLFHQVAGLSGVTPVFWKIAQKPGKPMAFGVRGRKLWFGLPGNPVSALVCFHLYVKPVLLKRMGRPDYSTWWVQSATRQSIRRHATRTEFYTGRIENGRVRILPQRGSHCLGGFARSNVLVKIDPGKSNGALGTGVWSKT